MSMPDQILSDDIDVERPISRKRASEQVENSDLKCPRYLSDGGAASSDDTGTFVPILWQEMTEKQRRDAIMPFLEPDSNGDWELPYRQAEGAMFQSLPQHSACLRQLVSPILTVASEPLEGFVSDLIHALQEAAKDSELESYALFCYLGYAAQVNKQAQQLLDTIYEQAPRDELLTELHWWVICRRRGEPAACDDVQESPRTPLHYAIMLRELKATTWLIDHRPHLCREPDSMGRTPLYMAAACGDVELLNLLLKHCPDDTHRANNSGTTPFMITIINDHVDALTALFSRDKTRQDDDGDTALHCAADKGREKAVRTLITLGADKDVRNNYNETPLHCAAYYGYDSVVSTLIELGADKDARNDDNDTALHYAAAKGHYNVVNTLIELGADRDACNSNGYTALHDAARNGYSKVARILITSGADINAQSDEHWTPLHLVAEAGHYRVANMLLGRGANKNIRTQEGDKPLYIAIHYKQLDVVGLLLQKGAKPRFKCSAPSSEEDNYDTLMEEYKVHIDNIYPGIEEVFQAGFYASPHAPLPKYLALQSHKSGSFSLQKRASLALKDHPEPERADLYWSGVFKLPLLPLGYYYNPEGAITSCISGAAQDDEQALKHLNTAITRYSQKYPHCLEQWLETMSREDKYSTRKIRNNLHGYINRQQKARVGVLERENMQLKQQGQSIKTELAELRQAVLELRQQRSEAAPRSTAAYSCRFWQSSDEEEKQIEAPIMHPNSLHQPAARSCEKQNSLNP